MSAFRVAGLLACVWLVAGVELAGAEENWPRFRGVDGNSVVADDSRLPEVWDRKTNVAWKTEIPGLGWGSPIVWGDRVYVSSVHSLGAVLSVAECRFPDLLHTRTNSFALPGW